MSLLARTFTPCAHATLSYDTLTGMGRFTLRRTKRGDSRATPYRYLYLIACDVAQNMINTIPTLDAPGNVSVTSFCPEGFVVPIGTDAFIQHLAAMLRKVLA